MRRRLYWMLPDVDSARRCANDLLLARIEDRHMHFLARRGVDLAELHEASMLQKSDVRHGALLGGVIGGIMGGLVAVGLSFVPLGDWSINHAGVLLLIGFGIFLRHLDGESGRGLGTELATQALCGRDRARRRAVDGRRAFRTRRRDPRVAAGQASRGALGRRGPDSAGVSVTMYAGTTAGKALGRRSEIDLVAVASSSGWRATGR